MRWPKAGVDINSLGEMMMNDSVPAREKEDLEIAEEIARAKRYVWLWVAICCGSYLLWFILWAGKWVGESPSSGGPFGDYFGGLINPIVALAAFYWITKGVRLQKSELAETRDSLKAQADHARTSVRIDALSSMIDALTSDITYRRDHLAFLVRQQVNKTTNAFYSMRGRVMDKIQFDALVRDLNAGINVRQNERTRLAGELRDLLTNVRTPEEHRMARERVAGADQFDDGAPA